MMSNESRAKAYLRQYRTVRARLRAVETMIEEIRTELQGLGVPDIRSPWPDGQPHGTGTTDPTGAAAAASVDSMAKEYREKLRRQLVDLEVREHRARSELWRQRVEIEETIGAVADPVLNEILHRKYIEAQTFELIAVEMNYSWRHTIRLHGMALAEVEKILKK